MERAARLWGVSQLFYRERPCPRVKGNFLRVVEHSRVFLLSIICFLAYFVWDPPPTTHSFFFLLICVDFGVFSEILHLLV